MSKSFDLVANLRANVTDFVRGLKISEDQLKSMKRSAEDFSSVGSKLTKTGNTLTKAITVPAVGAITALTGITLVKGFDRLRGIDTAQSKLTALGHDAEGVEDIMTSALDSVRGTAFGMGEAATTAANAVAAGIPPGKELTRYLTLTGDAAAIAGTDLSEMGSIINKVTTSGKAYNGELQQLSDRGIPIYQWLADEAGVAADAVFDLASEGQISSEMLLNAIETNVAGAAKTMGELSFSAAWDNLWAAVGRLGASFLGAGDDADSFFASVKKLIGDMTKWIDTLGPTVEQMGIKFRDNFNMIIDKAKELKASYDALDPGQQKLLTDNLLALATFLVALGPVMKGLGLLYTIVSTVITAIGVLTTFFSVLFLELKIGAGIFAAFKTALLTVASPALLITGLIIGLIAAGIALFYNWDRTKAKAKEVWGYVSEFISNSVAKAARFLEENFNDLYVFLSNTWGKTKALAESVWGGITNVFQKARDKSSEIIESLGGTIERLGGYFSQLGGVLAPVGVFFSDIGTSIGELWGRMSDFSILEQVNSLFGTLRDTLSGLWETFSNSAVFTVFGSALGFVVGKAIAFKDAVVALVRDFDIQPMVDQIIQFMPKIIAIFFSKPLGLILGGANIIKMIAEGMGMTVPELFEMVTDTLVGMIEQFAEALPKYVEMGTEMLISLIEGIVAMIPQITDTAITIIVAIVEGLLGAIVSLVEVGITLLTALIDGIVTALPLIIGVATQLLTTLVGAIVMLLPVIIEVGISLLMALIDGIIGILPVLIETGLMIITTLLDVLISLLPIIIETGITILMALIDGIIAILPVLIETGINLIISLVDAIIGLLPIIIEAGIQLIMALVDGLIQMLPSLVDAGITLIISLSDALISMLPAIIEAGITLIMSLVDAFIGLVPTIIDAGIKLIMALIGGIIQVLPALIQAGITLILALAKAILGLIPTILSAGVQILWALIKGILSIVGQLLSAAAQLMGSLLSAILGFLGKMLSAGGQLIVSLIRGITGAISGVGRAVSDGMSSAWKIITNFASRFREAGANIVSSIASGITGAISKVTGAVSGVLKKARDLLPFSPPKDKSSPLVDIHKNGIIEQIAKGIYNEESTLQKAMNSVLGAVSTEMGTMDINGEIARSNAQVNSTVSHEINDNTGTMMNRLINQIAQGQKIYLNGEVLVGETYSEYDRVGGNKTQLAGRWGL